PRLDQDLTRLRSADRGQLDERRARSAVRLDLEALHERWRGAAGAHARRIVPKRVDGLLELRLGRREKLLEGHYACTSVPTCSPLAARTSAFSCDRSNTMIGVLRSAASAAAVVSITPSCLS